jgi:hypothetical protein
VSVAAASPPAAGALVAAGAAAGAVGAAAAAGWAGAMRAAAAVGAAVCANDGAPHARNSKPIITNANLIGAILAWQNSS